MGRRRARTSTEPRAGDRSAGRSPSARCRLLSRSPSPCWGRSGRWRASARPPAWRRDPRFDGSEPPRAIVGSGMPIHRLDHPPRSAELVIVGGGIVGAATAFHAARAGLRPLIVERRPALASLTTAAAAGGYRLQLDD